MLMSSSAKHRAAARPFVGLGDAGAPPCCERKGGGEGESPVVSRVEPRNLRSVL